MERFVASLPAGRVLDIGCGTGYLTRSLCGTVTAVDQSAEMLELARARVPAADFVQADVPPLPFPDGAFDLAFSSNVYSHLDARRAGGRRGAARRRELVKQAWQPGLERESWELRPLLDGSVYRVFKRYLTGEELAHDLAGELVFVSPEFVAVRT